MKEYQKELAMHPFKEKQAGFEGWYFRITNWDFSLAIIIGISTAPVDPHTFIQVLDTITHTSRNIKYSMAELKCTSTPFRLEIGDCIFSEEGLHLDIQDVNFNLQADIIFEDYHRIETSGYAPTIMGPFSYLKNMECVHSLISLKHHSYGKISMNGLRIQFDGVGYIEKDRGISFPSKYLWLQSNHCQTKEASLFLSIASIPMKMFHFTGIIGVLMIGGKQIRFASYYGARLSKAFKKENRYYLVLRQFPYRIYMEIEQGITCGLQAPRNGQMSGQVEEGLEAYVTIQLYKYHTCIEQLAFVQCGLEISNFFE